MKNWQALNTILAMIAGNYLAESWDAWAAATAGLSPATMELVLTGVLGGVASWLLEWGRALGLDLTDAGRMPRLYKLLGGVLVALALVGCASSKSIPTSSDANVSADVVTAKGGTIACATMLRATLDPATGNVTSLACDENGAWTDPPTTEETTALGEFARSLVDLARIPFALIAGALSGAAGSVTP